MGLRIIFRSLLRQRMFSLVAVLTIALGIGAATAMFSFVEAVLLRELPFKGEQRLVMVWNKTAGSDRGNLSGADLLDFEEGNESFEELAAFSPLLLTARGEAGTERFSGVEVTPNFFRALGAEMALGQDFLNTPEGRFVILGHEYWQVHQGGRQNVIGESLRLNGVSYEVAGVAPAGFQIPFEDGELWIRAGRLVPAPPADFGKAPEDLRGVHWLRVIGRLDNDATLAEAEAELKIIAERLAREYPEDNAGRSVRLVPLRDEIQQDARAPLWILFGSVCLLLAIAMVNVAGLLLTRCDERRRELAIRRALGAGRRLFGELLLESLCLSLLGGVGGLFLAQGFLQLIRSLSPLELFGMDAAGLNPSVAIFALVVSLVTGIGFGVLPATDAFRGQLASALRAGGRRATAAGSRLRAAMVTTQIALAMVLLVGAGLLLRSFTELSAVDPGFESKQVLSLNTWLAETQFEEEEVRQIYSQMLDEFEKLPGVQSASAVLGVPLGGMSAGFTFLIEGRDPPTPGNEPHAGFQSVAPKYFETLQIPIHGGRDFDERDREDSLPVAVVNSALAERHFAGENPLGQRLSIDDDTWHEIIGVVGNVRHDGLDEMPRAEVYLSYQQATMPFMSFVLKAHDAETLIEPARAAVARIHSDVPLYKVRTLDEVKAASVAEPRFRGFVLGLFASISIALACVGLYGLVSYMVTLRTQEFGIRMAMGAQIGHIATLVLKESLRLASYGTIAGLAGSLILSRFLQNLLFRVESVDVTTYALAPIVLLGAVLLASLTPTFKATRTNPLDALRAE